MIRGSQMRHSGATYVADLEVVDLPLECCERAAAFEAFGVLVEVDGLFAPATSRHV